MSRKHFFVWAIVLSVLVAIPLTASTAYRRIISATPRFTAPDSKFSTTPVTQQADSEDVPKGLMFELRPSGFIPSEVTVDAGKYLLLLQNRSGLKGLSFRLERENESRVAESDQQKRDWKAQVRLSPGTYILSEASHPEWRSVITVTPR
jgi:hypothetical protein